MTPRVLSERGDAGYQVIVIGVVLLLSVMASAVFIGGRTTAQSTGRDIARSLAEHTSYVCRDYRDADIGDTCPYISEAGIPPAGCVDTTAGRTPTMTSWVCEWSGLDDETIPEEPARLLGVFHSDRTEVVRIRLENDHNAASVRVSVRICSQWSMAPLGRWCGEETASHHL